MKKAIIILLLLSSINIINSQNLNTQELLAIKKELIEEKNKIIDSIKQIDVKLNYLKSKENESDILGDVFTKTTVKIKAAIKNKPSLFGDVIGYVPKSEFLQVYDYYDGYWSIKYDTIIGYTSDMYLSNRRELNSKRDNYKANIFIKKYGSSIGNKISNHTYWIGMTAEMARESLGRPLKINTSSGSWGIHEQWVYDNRNLFLYFEDGILTSFQN